MADTVEGALQGYSGGGGGGGGGYDYNYGAPPDDGADTHGDSEYDRQFYKIPDMVKKFITFPLVSSFSKRRELYNTVCKCDLNILCGGRSDFTVHTSSVKHKNNKVSETQAR
ncbi:hypothetical protein PR048_032802 [Dryococelus australis]|uniref:Uncharacterized protein n=1 Tax=Dryococelus australis TaxID=614101 RepID=A0ABQ9G394_9NEOP|nr:hypothetical protein PR048_032802 [Dryococelus australis]